MLLDAVPLTEEEEKFLNENPFNAVNSLGKAIRSPQQNLTLMFSYMIGKSSTQISEFLSEQFNQNYTYEQYLANCYEKSLESGSARFNASMIKSLIEGVEDQQQKKLRIADWGAGPMVVARLLNRPVLSLDISNEMLYQGKRKIVKKKHIIDLEKILR